MSAVFENRGLSQFSAMLGGGLSLLCAVHCALVPLLFLLTPTFKLALYSVRDPNHKIAIWMLASLRYERWMVWLGVIFAALALFSNAKASKRSTQLFFLGSALSLAGVYSPGQSTIAHSGLMMLGGLVLFYAVLLNARQCRS